MDCLISLSDFKHWMNPLICPTNYVQTAEEASGQEQGYSNVNAVHKHTHKYKCQTCDKAFVEKHRLKAHLVQHGGDPVE